MGIVGKIAFVRDSLKIYGLRGVWDYLKSLGHRKAIRGMFSDNARRNSETVPSTGFTLIGEFSSKGSLGKVMRDLAHSLKDAGIPFQTFDTGRGEVAGADLNGILTPRAEFNIMRYGYALEMIASELPDGIVPRRGRIVFWEFGEGCAAAYPRILESGGDVVTMSDFTCRALAREFAGRRQVRKLLYPLRVDVSNVPAKPECRRRFGFRDDDFIVFYNFSYKSGWYRKNPEGALRAFASAFKAKSWAVLAFKTVGSDEYPDRAAQLARIAEEEGVADRVHFFDEWMPEEDVYALTNCCDVYLSLHRAEGFGLGVAEAMSLGKAVVITDYSATMEFCNDENAICIPYETIAVPEEEKRRIPTLIGAKFWADPDTRAAASALGRLMLDDALRARLGANASRTIADGYSVTRFRESAMALLRG